MPEIDEPSIQIINQKPRLISSITIDFGTGIVDCRVLFRKSIKIKTNEWLAQLRTENSIVFCSVIGGSNGVKESAIAEDCKY